MKNKFVISIKRIDDNQEIEKLELETPQDNDIFEWVNVFKTILTWVTFEPATIKEIFYDEYGTGGLEEKDI
jgi:hypothetical protein